MATKTEYTVFDIEWVRNEDNSYKRSRKATKWDLECEADAEFAGPLFTYYEIDIAKQGDEAAIRAALSKELNKFTGYTNADFKYVLGWE